MFSIVTFHTTPFLLPIVSCSTDREERVIWEANCIEIQKVVYSFYLLIELNK